jgi:double-strand break repair protein MRE11
VNYEDPNFNVAIPVFSIHGNHDDPQGVGAEGALSAVDLLSMSGLLNYFGKVELPTVDEAAYKGASEAPINGGLTDVGLRIRPVLLRKGETKVALYGMGNIKDERMHFELRTNRVRMYRPNEDPEDWFNILTIHQNRAAHNPKAVVPETMFDDSMHLVIWGHEHEQLIQPQAVAGKRYRICQPGSSVATSLCPGEAVEKQVAILSVKKRDFRMEYIPLTTVRPFVMEEIDLDKVAEEAKVPIDDKNGIADLLKSRVQQLIDRADLEWEETYRSKPAAERPERLLPLIRLRVHYTRHEMGNLIRFGQTFTKTVANPRDLLQFAKKKGEAITRAMMDADDQHAAPNEGMLPAEKLEKVRMSDLVKAYLTSQDLQVLTGSGLERAINRFVEKDDRDAISSFISKEMKHINTSMTEGDELDEHGLDAEFERFRMEKVKIAAESRESDDASEGEKSGKANTKDQTSRRRHGSLDDSFDSDDSMLNDDVFTAETAQAETPRPRAQTSTANRGCGRVARSTATARSAASRPVAETQGTLTFRGDSDSEVDGEEQASQPPRTLSSRAAALSRPSTSKKAGGGRGGAAVAKKTASAKRAVAGTTSARTARGQASDSPPSRRNGTRAAAQKAVSRLAESLVSGGEEGDGGDDDDDVAMMEDSQRWSDD